MKGQGSLLSEIRERNQNKGGRKRWLSWGTAILLLPGITGAVMGQSSGSGNSVVCGTESHMQAMDFAADAHHFHKIPTSQGMKGKIALMLVFAETKNSGPFTNEEIEQLLGKAEQNLDWWSRQAAKYGVDVFFEIAGTASSGLRVDLSRDYTKEASLIPLMHEVITNVSHTATKERTGKDWTSVVKAQEEYLEKHRKEAGADHAFIIHIVKGEKSFRSHTFREGPYVNMWYKSMLQGDSFAHEIGHLFGLYDEYPSIAAHTARYEVNGFPNANAWFRNPVSVPNMMRNNWGLSAHTAAQLGWINRVEYTEIRTNIEEGAYEISYPLQDPDRYVFAKRFQGGKSFAWGRGTKVRITPVPEISKDGELYTPDQVIPIDIVAGESDVVQISFSPAFEKSEVSISYITEAGTTAGEELRDIFAGKNRKIAFATSTGAGIFDHERKEVIGFTSGDSSKDFQEPVQSVVQNEGGFLFSAEDNQLILWDGGKTGQTEGPRGNRAYSALATDHANRVWAASNASGFGTGLHSYSGTSVTEYNRSNSAILANSPNAVAAGPDGSIWIGFRGASGGMQRYQPEEDKWENVSGYIDNNPVNRIRAIGGKIYVATPQGVYKGKGMAWEKLIETQYPVYDLDIDSEQNMVLGTSRGLIVINSSGEETRINMANSALPEDRITAVRVTPDDVFYAGTANNGLFTLKYHPGPAEESLVTEEQASGEEEFGLFRNYPNPFNPSTVIHYQLPEASDVRLEVFDLLGRKISTLVQEKQSRGAYEVRFDASGFSSGIYIYRLETPFFTDVRQMTYIK